MRSIPDSVSSKLPHLPDGPGVYLWKGADGKILYVGKAKRLRSRVRSYFAQDHYENPKTTFLVNQITDLETIVVPSEAHALILEANLIKEYRPRFNIALRDDKSYPYIKVTVQEAFPRVYVTRQLQNDGARYFGPYTDVGSMRRALNVVKRIFTVRSCNYDMPREMPERPCLDYFIKRCGAPCVGYVSPEEYRASIEEVVAFLQGRYREIERDLERRMKEAAAAQEFEQAALERNRLRAVRSLLERQRVANESVGTLDAVAVAVSGTDANAQVFQVRDGVLSDRQSFYLANDAAREIGDVGQEFLLQYYAGAISIPPQVIVQGEVEDLEALGELLSERRGGRVEVRAAERGDKRRILDLAERNARLAMDTERLKVERRHQQRVEALDALQVELGLDVLPIRIECFDISNLMGTNTVASMVAFEGGAPKKSDYRRFNIRGGTEGVPDDFAAMEEVLSRRYAQWERQQDLSPHDPKRNESFATLPSLIVIDGGPGQLAAGLRALEPWRERGVAVISLAKRLEEVHRPGVREPLRMGHDTPALQLLQRIRDEAHRFAITHHRTRRDKEMTQSLLDELPGIGPARKRALLQRFGSPEGVAEATREQLEAVPGVPAKIARDVYAILHRTGE